MMNLRLSDFAVMDLLPLNLIVSNQIICLSGPSGSGKSVLLRAIADLTEHRGEAFLDEQMCSATHPVQWRKWVGYLPAESAWWLDKVGEHFHSKECENLQHLGLPADSLNWELARCSTGEKQRFAIARLLEQQPRVLLLDEPTACLDPESVERVETLIRDYSTKHNTPVIWVSHDTQQIKRVAAKHYEIKDHEVVEASI